MKKLVVVLILLCGLSSFAEQFIYSFHDETLAEALTKLAEEHKDIKLNFIYDELDKYRVNTNIHTDDPYDAIRSIIGFHPVSVLDKDSRFYVEALQHGKYMFTGRTLSRDDAEPLDGTTVLILNTKDSTVITFGITDRDGYFTIPCDRSRVIAKISRVGYETTYLNPSGFDFGDIHMSQVPIYLNNLNVEADNQLLASDKTIYLPTQQQKKASQTAVDLLARMAIPQLSIAPGSDEVKDVFGNNVVIFINYMPTGKEDLQGMKMTDVRKIEYLEYPADPRFKGERHVLNFIVQEYEYGGYTKTSLSETILNGFSNTVNVMSKFSYKRMTYDVFAGSENNDFHHIGSDIQSKYTLGSAQNPYVVTRSETVKDSHSSKNEFPVTLRASYGTQTFITRHTVSFTHTSRPDELISGNLNIDLNPEKNSSYSRNSPRYVNDFSYSAICWNRVSDKISFDINPSFQYTHRRNYYDYASTLSDRIDYRVKENVYVGRMTASLGVAFSSKNQLSIGLTGYAQSHNVAYSGSVNFHDSYLNVSVGQKLRYNFKTKKFSFGATAGLAENFYALNSAGKTDVSPFGGINGNILLTEKSQVSFSLYLDSWIPGISLRANGVVPSNEFLYLTGNPGLKSSPTLSSNIAYNRFRNNAFNIAFFAGHDTYFNRTAAVYVPYDHDRALLRDLINNGNYTRGYLGSQINYKLFKNSLQLYANLSENIYHTTGIYNSTLYSFRIQLQAAYYWKSFNVIASWVNPSKRLTENSNVVIRDRNYHTFSVGWGNGILNITLRAANFFNKGWLSTNWTSYSPLYTESRVVYSPNSHPNINLSVTYTISYGKKIQQNNEIGKQSTGPSVIIEEEPVRQ